MLTCAGQGETSTIVYNATRQTLGDVAEYLADPKERSPMKRSLRALLLLVGLVGTFAYAAIPKAPAPDPPMPLCPPHHPNCDE